MATLQELLGQPIDPDAMASNALESLYDTSDVQPLSPLEFDVAPTVDAFKDSSAIDGAGRLVWESLGLPVYSFLDTASFGLLGLAVPDKIEEDYFTPKTKIGQVTSAVGGTAGFVVGGPMKLGAKATQMVAKPFIKKAGVETVKEFTKKSSKAVLNAAHRKQFATSAKKKIVEKEIGQTISQLSHQHRWDQAGKGVAKNWKTRASNAIDNLADEAVTKGRLTAKEADLVRNTFKQNVGARPMQDFVDIVMSRHPNKYGFVVGSMINEGIMFGLIDAAMEGVHAIREDRPYDFTAPLWGVGVGSAFGLLKWLPAAGKSSITSTDFKGGVKAVFSKNYFKDMKEKTLIRNAEIIGRSAKLNNQDHTVKFGKHTIDLLNPIDKKNKKESIEILRNALNQERKRYGKEMMSAAVKEDFQSSLANWKRVLIGTGIMNIRSSVAIAQGHEMDPTDIMTSLMIGAFLNRRGVPLTPDMNIAKMNTLRKNLHAYGVPQARLYDLTPTLHDSQFSHINPISHRSFRKLRKQAEDLEIMGDTPEQVENSNAGAQKSPALGASQKTFPLFDKFYQWIQTASNKKYIKPKALVTEAEAKAIERSLRETDFDGKKIKTMDDFDTVMNGIQEGIVDKLNYLLKKTGHESILLSTDWQGAPNKPSDNNLGTMPQRIVINQNLLDKVEAGRYKDLDTETVIKYRAKAQKVLESLHKIMVADQTQNPKYEAAEVTTIEQLRRLVETVDTNEQSIISTFNIKRRGGNFEFENDLDDLIFPLLQRGVKKGYRRTGNFFSDTDNPNWNNEVIPALKEAGLIKEDPQAVGGFRLVNFTNIKWNRPEGYKGGSAEALAKSVIGILAAKGNKSLKVDTKLETEVSVDQMHKLEGFLNSNKVATQKELLDYFRADMTQRLYADVAKGTQIQATDIKILQELAGLGIPLANYATLADGGTGFSVAKIDLLSAPKDARRTEVRAIKEFNEYVDALVGRGTNKQTNKKFIHSDRTISFKAGAFGKNEAIVIRDIIRRAGTKAQQNAQETLMDIVKTLDPASTIRASVIKYLEGTNDPDAFFNFAMGEGFIAPKGKKDAIAYVLNEQFINRKESQQKIIDWLSKFGVHTSDVEKIMDAARKDLEVLTSNKATHSSGTISQQQFFEKWFPDATKQASKHQDAESQKKIMDRALMSAEPHRNLIEQMEVEVGKGTNKKIVLGKDILRLKIHSDKKIEILDDVQKMLALRSGSKSVNVLSLYNTKVQTTIKNIQRNPFTNFLDNSGIPYVFVDGEVYTQYFSGKKMRTKSLNIFELDSPHNTNRYTKSSDMRTFRDEYYKQLDRYDWGGGKDRGVRLIRMGNAKEVIAIPTTAWESVKDLYKKEIVDRFAAKARGSTKDKIMDMWDHLQGLKSWTGAHEDAMRAIIVKQMITGKDNPNRFLHTLQRGHADEYSDLGKRFSLYHTPSFKRIDKALVTSLLKNVDAKDATVLGNFLKRDLGFIVWNDDGMANMQSGQTGQRIENLLTKKKSSYKKMLGSRPGASEFDSITFISADFKRLLELYYGVSQRGSNIFKPVISSSGENDLLFSSKTVFIHDPDIQNAIFGKHKGLDILTTRSGDKLKASISDTEWANLPRTQQPNRIRYMDKTIDEMLNLTTKDISSYLNKLSMDKIGVTIIPDVEMNARQSYSNANYFNNSENTQYYNSFYKAKVDKLLGSAVNSGEGVLKRIAKDNIHKSIALLQMKGADLGTDLTGMGGPQSLKNLGHHVQVAAMGGDVRMMGEDVLFNTIKSQFLDPILSPESVTDKGQRYGGKAVIKQSFIKFRDLDITVRTGEGENTRINPGEIVLPHNTRDGSISFYGDAAEMVLRAVDGKGNVRSLKEVMMEAWDKRAGVQAKGKSRTGRIIYEVKVDMFEHPTLKNIDLKGRKSAADVWVVDNLAEANAQLKAIKSGWGSGKNFAKKIVKGKTKGQYILKHAKGDHKYIYIRGNEPKNLKLDSKGRAKGQSYRQLQKAKPIIAQENWDYLIKNGTLGQAHDALKRIDPTYSVGILTTRYPRTAPNDLAILKLKGFLEKDHGNAAIVNPFDVVNIFEGDYDVDEVDFFWGMNRSTWDHVGRVNRHWVNTTNPDFYKGKTPDLDLLTMGQNNGDWNSFDANNRMFNKGIGIVQKTPRILSHIQSIGVKNEKAPAGDNPTGGMRDIIKWTNADGKQVKIALDYDNASYFERSALEAQLIIDYWKGVSPDIVGNMVDWRNDYLFPAWSKSITKDNMQSLEARLADPSLKGPHNKRIRIFRKFVKEGDVWKEGAEYEFSGLEKLIIQTQMQEHSKFLALTGEVYDNSGASQNASYKDIMNISTKYFGHLKDITKSAYIKALRKYGNNKDVQAMFATQHLNNARTAKKITYLQKNPNKKNNEELARINAEIESEVKQNRKFGSRTYVWNQKSPFYQGVRDRASEIAQSNGQRGSVMERIYREILERDPFGDNSDKGRVSMLKGDAYNEFMSVSSMLLNEHYTFDNVEQIRDIIPKSTKKFNEDVKNIIGLKRLQMQILNSRDLSEKVKTKRVAGLKKLILEREANIKELLPKKYLESGRIKDLEKIKLVDISRDKDIIEGTVQWYTLYNLSEKFNISGSSSRFFKQVGEAIELGGQLYSEFNEMGASMPFHGRTILTEPQTKLRLNPLEGSMDIEGRIAEKLDQGYIDHGIPFLIHYAMPKKTQTTIGVYNGIPMPVSIKGTGRLKRSVKFMLDKMNAETDKVKRLELKEAIEVLTKRYAAYRNYFDGNFDAIPTMDRDMMGLLNNAPGFNDNLKTVFDRYESMQIQKGRFAQDVFGMGPDYDNNVNFYRRLMQEGIGKKSELELKETTELLSYTNQLLMENDYLDPITYMLMVRGVRKDLQKLGLDKAELMGVQGGENSPINIHSKDSDLAVLAGNKGGISIRPMMMMTDFKVSMLRSMIKQGKDLKKYDKASRDWSEKREEYNKKGFCKPGN